MNETFSRFLAFLRGDFRTAEAFGDAPQTPVVEWIEQANQNPELAKYALEAAIRSATDATSGIDQVRARAGTLLSTLVTLIPIILAATGFVASWADNRGAGGVVALVLLLTGDAALVVAVAMAFLASAGVREAGGLNVARLTRESNPSVPSLQAAEADAWHNAAELARFAMPRLADTLFQARRFVVLAFTCGLISIAVMAFTWVVGTASSGGSPGTTPSPVESSPS